jgi:hypothetical protein
MKAEIKKIADYLSRLFNTPILFFDSVNEDYFFTTWDGRTFIKVLERGESVSYDKPWLSVEKNETFNDFISKNLGRNVFIVKALGIFETHTIIDELEMEIQQIIE